MHVYVYVHVHVYVYVHVDKGGGGRQGPVLDAHPCGTHSFRAGLSVSGAAMEAVDRRAFLQAVLGVAAGPALLACARAAGPSEPAEKAMKTVSRMPVLFVGHGSPMNAIEDNPWSRAFAALADNLPRPRAILAVSAHWYVRGTYLTVDEHPKTIHDFGGFPQPLYEVQYPAPGDPALARRVMTLVGRAEDALSSEWGLDHGTWSVLRHLQPRADVPVVQLSIDATLPAEGHLLLGRSLAALRDEGVLVMGSGNITHNLAYAMTHGFRGDLATPDWAASFDADVARAVGQHDAAWLVRALAGDNGSMSHPTPDHYLPLIYAAGAADPGDPVAFPVTGFDFGSLSMRAIRFG